jgi:hypothetical protein
MTRLTGRGSNEFAQRALEQARESLKSLDALSIYCRSVHAVRQQIDTGHWKDAEERWANTAVDPMFDDGYFRLMNAIRVGASARRTLDSAASNRSAALSELRSLDLTHPLHGPLREERERLEESIEGPLKVQFNRMLAAAARICATTAAPDLADWLTMPMAARPEDVAALKHCVEEFTASPPRNPQPGIRRLTKAAGSSMVAIHAALGEVDIVAGGDISSPLLLPHNLGVAAFSHLHQVGAATQDRLVALALGVAALFACVHRYRIAVAAQLGWALPPDLALDRRAVRDALGNEVKRLLTHSGVSWGEINDRRSWACRWEAECFAVSQLGADHGQIAWPFGPTLIDFYELQPDLAAELARRPAVRPWFGPCAEGNAMLFLNDPASALAALPAAVACTLQQAKLAPGYATLPDALVVLQKDVRESRAAALFACMRQAAVDASVADEWPVREMADWCEEVLRLIAEGTETKVQFTNTLKFVFDRMLAPSPETQLAKKRARASARKRCMDTIIAAIAAHPEHDVLAGFLRTQRSKMSLLLIDHIFDIWRQSNDVRLPEEMARLSEEAATDAPANRDAGIMRPMIVLLRASRSDPAVAQPLRESAWSQLQVLKERAVAGHWPVEMIKTIEHLQGIATAGPDVTAWVASLWHKGRAAQEDDQ